MKMKILCNNNTYCIMLIVCFPHSIRYIRACTHALYVLCFHTCFACVLGLVECGLYIHFLADGTGRWLPFIAHLNLLKLLHDWRIVIKKNAHPTRSKLLPYVLWCFPSPKKHCLTLLLLSFICTMQCFLWACFCIVVS